MKKLLLGLLVAPALAFGNYALDITLKHDEKERTEKYVIAADSGIIYQISNENRMYIYVDAVKEDVVTINMMVSKIESTTTESGQIEEKEISAGQVAVETKLGQACTVASPVESLDVSAIITVTETDAPATAIEADVETEEAEETEEATEVSKKIEDTDSEDEAEEDSKDETPEEEEPVDEVTSEEKSEETKATN